jgi:hypothetical protein
MDEVPRREVLELHSLGADQIEQLADDARAALPNITDPALQQQAEAFIAKVDGMDDDLRQKSGVTARQLTTALNQIRSNNPGNTTLASLRRQEAVAEALSDYYHEVGQMLGADDRALTEAIVGAADRDLADDFMDWIKGETTVRRAGSIWIGSEGLDPEDGVIRFEDMEEPITINGEFSSVEISYNGGQTWEDLQPGTVIEPDNDDEIDVIVRQIPPSWALSADASAGDDTVQVANVDGLQVGARIRVPDGRWGRTFTVRAIDPATNTVTLNRALRNDVASGAEITQGSGGRIEVEALIPTWEAVRAAGPFWDLHQEYMELPAAELQARIDSYNEFHNTNLDAAAFEAIGPALEWEAKRRWYKQIEAAGTAAKGLWFDNAREFYIPRSRRNTGNFFIDTLDLLFHSELVNEVQIELGLEAPYVERIRDLDEDLDRDRASLAMKWATATNSPLLRGTGTRALRSFLGRLKALPDGELQTNLDAINEYAKGEGSPWAQDPSDDAPVFPLTVNDLRTMEPAPFTAANRDRAVRTDGDTETNLAGAQFVFDEYRRAQRYLVEAKQERILDLVNWATERNQRAGTPVVQCSQWGWVNSDMAKGQRGLTILKEQEGPAPDPNVVMEAEPNNSRQDLTPGGPNTLPNGGTVKGAIVDNQDVDTFQFEVPAGAGNQKIVLDMAPPAGENLNLLLFDDQQNRPIGWSSARGDAPERIEYEVRDGRTKFFARITRGAGNRTGSPNQYTLTGSWAPSTNMVAEVEPNNSNSNATGTDNFLPAGSVMEGLVSQRGDIDSFRIDLASPANGTDPIKVTLDSPAGHDFYPALFDDSGFLVSIPASNSAQTKVLEYVPAQGTTSLFIKVRGRRGDFSAADKYQLKYDY